MKINKGISFLSFIILLIPVISFSQTDNILLKGKIIEEESNLPLSYVSIGIFNKPVGTIADTSGNYNLIISNENLTDTLQISLVGYATKRILVNDFIKEDNKNIKLTRKYFLLPDVMVTNKKYSTEIIGRQQSGKLIQISLHNKETADATIGSEMGMRVNVKRKGALLKDVDGIFLRTTLKV